jgi:hypothetical protein
VRKVWVKLERYRKLLEGVATVTKVYGELRRCYVRRIERQECVWRVRKV